MLEPRDLEILRALLRLRYLTTRQINATFFVTERIGRRRLQKLAEEGYIRMHWNGLPKTAPTGAWRLMSKGLQAIADGLRDEWIPEHLIDRVAEGSLLSLEEREPTSQIYLDLVVPDPPLFPDGPKIMQCRRWAHEIRRRAGAITWRPKHDVVLRYDFLGQQRHLVPDATITSPGRKLRMFLILDRPSKRRAWAGKLYERYNQFIGIQGPCDRGFSDGHEPWCVFVTDHQDRVDGIAGILENVRFKQMHPHVLIREHAARWFESMLVGAQGPVGQTEGRAA
jgi:hypothetical protein